MPPFWSGVTIRSVVAGFLLAILMASVNAYLTLKVGVIEEGTIITMMVFVLVLRLFRRQPTPQEAALVATMGSAGGSFSFIANFFAASQLSGVPLSGFQMVALPLVTGVAGLFMAIPLRRLFVTSEDPLPWPTSTATITSINAVTTAEGGRQAGILGISALASGLLVFLTGGVHVLPEASAFTVFGLPLALAWSPFLLSAGYLVGLRGSMGFLLGAFLMAGVVGPGGYKHWPGVAFLVASGLTALAVNYRTVWAALRSVLSVTSGEGESDAALSPRAFRLGLAATAVATVALLVVSFGVGTMAAVLMFVLGTVVLNLVATRAAGETSFNPIRVMGIMLQGVSALVGVRDPGALLASAGTAAGAIDQSSLLTQDSVFGRHFGLPIRRQWMFQLFAILPVSVAVAGVFTLILRAYPGALGGDTLPAAVAKTWSAAAETFSGNASLPPGAVSAMLVAAFFGTACALLDAFLAPRVRARMETGRFSPLFLIPSATGLGIALILPPAYSMAFALGGVVLCLILPRFFRVSEATLTSVASGGILGEGVVGLLNAILIAVGILAAAP